MEILNENPAWEHILMESRTTQHQSVADQRSNVVWFLLSRSSILFCHALNLQNKSQSAVLVLGLDSIKE